MCECDVVVVPGGGTHIFGRTGMCRSNGSLFYKKSLNMGPVFYQKILKHGQLFWMSTKFCKFGVFCHAKIAKFLKNRPKMALFSRKILKNGYPFWPKSPLKMGMGFEAWAAHPCPTQIWVPPGSRPMIRDYISDCIITGYIVIGTM